MLDARRRAANRRAAERCRRLKSETRDILLSQLTSLQLERLNLEWRLTRAKSMRQAARYFLYPLNYLNKVFITNYLCYKE
ncbi:unnamed protein product [Protopolystoma xenopodis]|uniref:BZIP domain-containing protein n=1 Tax=Protopolystoma xenopodis TaxID=117903 RepID=A0A448X071_9PLAT|nr:unnamed protein product [Protopolystoma xenopodis]